LRYSDRTPLTGRRYDLLWKRVQANLAWAGKLGVSAHWLRHTALIWVERHYGYAVARAYAGHTDTKGGSTLTYIKGMPQEVTRAPAAYTRETHPLAELGRLGVEAWQVRTAARRWRLSSPGQVRPWPSVGWRRCCRSPR